MTSYRRTTTNNSKPTVIYNSGCGFLPTVAGSEGGLETRYPSVLSTAQARAQTERHAIVGNAATMLIASTTTQ